MLFPVFLTALIDVIGSGDHADRIALFIGLPPLIVNIKNLAVGFPVRQTGLAVQKFDCVNLICGKLLCFFHPLQRCKIRCKQRFADILLFVRIIAAENNGCLCFCKRKPLTEPALACMHPACCLTAAVIRITAVIVHADIFFHFQNDAIHFAALELPVRFTLLPADFRLQILQRQLAFQRILTGAVPHLNQRFICVVCIVFVEFIDIGTCQRIDPVDLIGEILHTCPDAVIFIAVAGNIIRTEIADISLPVRIEIEIHRPDIADAVCGSVPDRRITVGKIRDLLSVSRQRLRIIPDLGIGKVLSAHIHMRLLIVLICTAVEIRLDGIFFQ